MKKEKEQPVIIDGENVEPVEVESKTVVEDQKTETIEEIVGQELQEETQPEEAQYEKGVVSNCSALNIREAPSMDANIIAILIKGTKVRASIYEASKDFYKVNTDKVSGYCRKQYITVY